MTPASVLIANRGEIAVRIIRAAKCLGIRPIVIFSEADRGALWTRMAEDSLCVGESAAISSYLAMDRIIEAARNSGVEAVHPGYGFLSESAPFARAVREAGLMFIGPSPHVIEMMGDKIRARGVAAEAGVPILPGAPLDQASNAKALAEEIGYPIMVKAAFGGGGRGMRIARNSGELADAMKEASSEAATAFGRAGIFLERLMTEARHIEVQVLGDSHGNLVVIGDRDCSLQRRHQKLIEEAPAPNISEDMRRRIHAASAAIAGAVSYEGVGTVEFLVDPERDTFFFLEMNTRLQVEHGVTEMVSGLDLVEWQFRVAAGERIDIAQKDIRICGHAIEARIAAEDPGDGFRPRGGRLTKLCLPAGPGIRVDFGVEEEDEIAGFYDSMFGKVLAWGKDRDMALRRLQQALQELQVVGVPTTSRYLGKLLDQPAFRCGTHRTNSLEEAWAQPDIEDTPPTSGEGVLTAPGRSIQLTWGGHRQSFVIPGRTAQDRVEASPGRPAAHRRAAYVTDDCETEIRSPMDAMVADVRVRPGTVVSVGDVLVLLEAMKMELPLRATRNGIVSFVHVKAGEIKSSGDPLVNLTDASPSPPEAR